MHASCGSFFFDEFSLVISMRNYDREFITKGRMKEAFVMYTSIRDKHLLSREILRSFFVLSITFYTNVVR